MATKVYPLREFNYGGEQKEKGEVFELLGLRNDQTLLRKDFRFVQEMKFGKGQNTNSLPKCDDCAKHFAEEMFLTQHYEGRIHPRSPNYAGEDARYKGEKPTPLQVPENIFDSRGAGVGSVPIYE